ncbi:diguanylate cyclase (GGDEF) domain-containing protein [Thiohalospira halophila DSM 15071]|uniref:diguanylate cyclase n=1 Tax=Thiohalospira halophila DSM 15071 TaxID=1123397 RepID=A0A1I1VZY6_9GAMM|nr:sensor domain-containing diguanylate cyclase [Thiohalospira halophila]SFD88517.1 diguanylate cyclase (GGDEF) domain-containing protein [Thiohalospira halophila DSM 15071]
MHASPESIRLEAERQQLQAVLRALPDISFVLDDEGRYVQVIGGSNEAMYADGQALEGSTLHQVLPPAVADHFLTCIREVLESGELRTLEYPLRVAEVEGLPASVREQARATDQQWFEARILPLPGFDHPRPVVLWVAVNITHRKALEDELRRAATIDPLTHLANRQHLLDLAREELGRARRYHHPLSLLMIDVDHFKRVNDRHGHAMGDAVLEAVARNCRQALRETDHLGRAGGEEFIAVLPETAAEGARTLARRLVEAVAGIEPPERPDDRSVTISVGAATLRPGEGVDELMLRADGLMYAAKAAGRNTMITDADAPSVPPE